LHLAIEYCSKRLRAGKPAHHSLKIPLVLVRLDHVASHIAMMESNSSCVPMKS
jgi:hypothetical protein